MACFDKYGVEFSDSKKTLVKCPEDFQGDYAIPGDVEIIASAAFAHCHGLTGIILDIDHRFQRRLNRFINNSSDGVICIDSMAFADCPNLTKIVVDGENELYDSRDNCNAIIDTSENCLVVGCKTTIIPDTVTSIGENAFYGCSKLKCIVIPKSVTSIGVNAFGMCNSLNEVILPNSLKSIGEGAFHLCSKLCVTIPDSVTHIGEGAFSEVLNIVYHGVAKGAPWGARSMNGYVDGGIIYSDSTRTKILACIPERSRQLTIPNTVTNIDERAFTDCKNLMSIDVDTNNRFFSTVDGVLFNKDKTILLSFPSGKQRAYSVPNTVEHIGDFAFCGCENLTNIVIPDSVTSIGWAAFSGCTNLKTITIGNGVINIKDRAFYACDGLTSVSIPYKDNLKRLLRQQLDASVKICIDSKLTRKSCSCGNKDLPADAFFCNVCGKRLD